MISLANRLTGLTLLVSAVIVNDVTSVFYAMAGGVFFIAAAIEGKK